MVRIKFVEKDGAKVPISPMTFSQNREIATRVRKTDEERIAWTFDVVVAGLNNALRGLRFERNNDANPFADLPDEVRWTRERVEQFIDTPLLVLIRDEILGMSGYETKKDGTPAPVGEEAAAS